MPISTRHRPQALPVETELAYQGSTHFASFIQGVTQSGYVYQDDDRYLKKSLPPLELDYSKPLIHEAVAEIDPADLEGLPAGLADPSYRWVDLDGEGISGILAEQGGGLYYLPNRGDGRIGPPRTVARKPPVTALTEGGQQLLDLAGDGQLDLVELDGPTPGFYERTQDRDWVSYRPFARLPNIPWGDPNLRFVDLNGNGHADVLISEDDVFTWHGSLAETGFGPAQTARKPFDEEQGPRVVFADGTQSIYLADMSGDGLVDLVRIRNSEVCYWPNLGYGRFGPKVSMDQAPLFDRTEQFEQQRIRLADIDGSGTSDILYLGHDGVRLYFNQSGNRWSTPHHLAAFPPVDDLSAVSALDLLGTGTACLVWSSPLPGHGRRPMRYIDLMGGQKPHLLIRSANNLGAETHVHYAPSTRFYLADKAAGRPWITRLPFPVQVVERVELYDCIGRNRFVTRYAYHHGHFDGQEREFRGFGMVEQWDTEELSALAGDDDSAEATTSTVGVLSCHLAGPSATNLDRAYQVPPVHTKTWFHTGVYLGHQHVSDFFAGLLDGRDRGEYYREPGLDDDQARALLLPDTHLPANLSAEEAREACRALKGSVLRQEIYALDDSNEGATRPYRFSEHPYLVSERNYDVKLVQPRGQNRHAVFFARPRETLDLHYERKLVPLDSDQWAADPRMTHGMTLEVDGYGNVLRSAAIAYPRRELPQSEPPACAEPQAAGLPTEQTETHVTLTINRVANRPDEVDRYRIGLPVETRTFELVNPPEPLNAGWIPLPFAFDAFGKEIIALLVAPESDTPQPANSWPYEYWDWRRNPDHRPDAGQPRLRLIEHLRSYYRSDDLSRRLDLGAVDSLALPFETYKLAFTREVLGQIYAGGEQNLLPAEPADILASGGPDRGGYRELDENGSWWIPSGRVFYSPNSTDDASAEQTYAREHFFLPCRYLDPFHATDTPTETLVEYDHYDLLGVTTRDPVDNVVTVRTADDAGETAVRIDYRLLQPDWITDPNGNRTQVAYDALGMLVGTAVMGKSPPSQREGDTLDGFKADLTEAEILDHLAHPLADPHAILGHATTRLVYDLFAYMRTRDQDQPRPAVVYSMARETHDADLADGRLTKVQHGFSYSDGFGREIQKKAQAEPGLAPRRDADGRIMIGADGQPLMTEGAVTRRWVGSGWTIFNNKGKPVRQYEPFFTDTHRFERDTRVGVSPILFYDPLGRVVATLHPNHTWEKVVFDPWRQETWDVNDTVAKRDDNGAALVANPQEDEHVGDFFRRLPEAQYLPTWYGQRLNGALGTQAYDAARKAAVHAETPTVACADTLGRTFLTIAHNRFSFSNAAVGDAPTEAYYRTQVVFDIEGNQREVIDARGRVVMRYNYDLLGNRIHQTSMDAGERWMLSDVAGNPIRAWDNRGHAFRTEYDQLRRPIGAYVRGAVQGDPESEILYERTEYGEDHDDATRLNLRTRVYRQYDGAGVVTNAGSDSATLQEEAYDFKGNLLRSRRQLAADYKHAPDWSDAPALESKTFTTSTTYDALNRPLTMTTPDGSVTRPRYNEANLLERIDVNLRGSEKITPFVTDIDYDAKGQRTHITYGNGAQTHYTYDPLTFRLTHLFTTRSATEYPDDCPNSPHRPCGLQNLHYTYDPAGNITHIRDDAQQTIFFRNRQVEPSNDYTYDAIYRLIDATGREHLGQNGGANTLAPTPTSHSDAPRVGLLHPGDGNAMGRYLQQYVYDEVGNILEMIHRGTDPANPGWRRCYQYAEDSNRLLSTGYPSEPQFACGTHYAPAPVYSEVYHYDAHGNMTRMPHLPLMGWDFKDQLQASARQVVNNGGTPEMTYYVYDASGQRVRKVTEVQGAVEGTSAKKNERIYVGVFEVYREYNGNSERQVELERTTLHVMDDQQRIALVETETVGAGLVVAKPEPVIRFQLNNHLGSSSVELDEDACVISHEEYYPYGCTSYQALGSSVEVSPKRYRYTGMERDEESGLNSHGMRYYAPWLGRWVSVDPAGLINGVNVYSYTINSPIQYTDRSGKDALDEAVANLESRLSRAQGIFGQTNELTQAVNNTARSYENKQQQLANINRQLQNGPQNRRRRTLERQRERVQNDLAEYSERLRGNQFRTRAGRILSAVEGELTTNHRRISALYEELSELVEHSARAHEIGPERYITLRNYVQRLGDTVYEVERRLSSLSETLPRYMDDLREFTHAFRESGQVVPELLENTPATMSRLTRPSAPLASVSPPEPRRSWWRRLLGNRSASRRAGTVISAFLVAMPFAGFGITMATYDEEDEWNIGRSRMEEAIAGETPIGTARDIAQVWETVEELGVEALNGLLNIVEAREDTPPPGSSDVDWAIFTRNVMTR